QPQLIEDLLRALGLLRLQGLQAAEGGEDLPGDLVGQLAARGFEPDEDPPQHVRIGDGGDEAARLEPVNLFAHRTGGDQQLLQQILGGETMAGNPGQGEENPHIARPDAPGASDRGELALEVDGQPLQRKRDEERGGRDVAELSAPFVRDIDEIAAADEGRCRPGGALTITACHAGDATTRDPVNCGDSARAASRCLVHRTPPSPASTISGCTWTLNWAMN